MQRKQSSALRANIKASTSFPKSGTELGDIFLCGTAKACSVKDCFKRSTHFHCSLCPDRKIVKEPNMVAHQIFHVTGRIEKRSVRDTHFNAYSGSCGRALCRFSLNNKKHHHCKICQWPCCGRKLQRCVGHMKSKHPEISIEAVGDMSMNANGNSQGEVLDESGNSYEVEPKEGDAVKMESREEPYDIKMEDEYEESKDDSEMIELNSMVWHHPITKKTNFENSVRVKVGEGNGEAFDGPIDEHHYQPESDQQEEKFDGDGSYEEDMDKQSGSSTIQRALPCRVAHCKEQKTHFHCHLCDFIAPKKILLDRHRNIHARGFIEKRKKRDMYFNGSDAACGVSACRFSVIKQRHHHCKLCGWACSSRKLQRCIKHIQDKHGVTIDNGQSDDAGFDSPRVIADPDLMTRPSVYASFHEKEEGSQGNHMNGESNDSVESDTVNSDLAPTDATPSDQALIESPGSHEIPHEDELFFLSKADFRCMVEKCALLGPHYHCNRCPYITRQKHCRSRHRAIHLKGFPERRMIRDQHFVVYEGICGRSCRFSVPKRKHFHCKYCDWACCARKLPRILNHLSRKHGEVLKDTSIHSPSAGFKRPRSFQPHQELGKEISQAGDVGDEENKVIILEEEGSQCSFVIKDVHSLRESSAMGDEPNHHTGESRVQIGQSNHFHSNPFERSKESQRDEKGFKPYKPPAYSYPPSYVNGHGPQLHPSDRPLTCRVCHAYPSESLSLRKMVVYSSSNRLELDLRLTSLLCTYFRVSIEEAFNSYICERDFEEWCNFHARKISVYPVIAIESSYDNHHPHVVPADEHYVQY